MAIITNLELKHHDKLGGIIGTYIIINMGRPITHGAYRTRFIIREIINRRWGILQPCYCGCDGIGNGTPTPA